MKWTRNAFILFPILLTNSPYIYADIKSYTTLASNYVSNGISQTDDKAALQFGIDYEHDTGVYVGGWASNVVSGYEVDFNTGYIYRANDLLAFDIGVTRFTYSDNDFEEDSDEYYVGCICLVGVLIYADGEYRGFDYINYDFRTEYEIQKNLAIGAHYGLIKLKDLDAEFYDYYFSVRKSYRKYDLALTYWYNEFVDDAATILSLTKSFDF